MTTYLDWEGGRSFIDGGHFCGAGCTGGKCELPRNLRPVAGPACWLEKEFWLAGAGWLIAYLIASLNSGRIPVFVIKTTRLVEIRSDFLTRCIRTVPVGICSTPPVTKALPWWRRFAGPDVVVPAAERLLPIGLPRG